MDQGVMRPGQAGVTRGETGFTLIELMIVVTILALLTVSVSLGVNRPRTTNAQDWSRFAALHDRLRAQAILSGEILGLSLDASGYQRLRWQQGDWVSVGTRAEWRDSVQVIAPFDVRSPVIFTPGGQASPVNLQFDTSTGATRCASDGWKAVSCSNS